MVVVPPLLCTLFFSFEFIEVNDAYFVILTLNMYEYLVAFFCCDMAAFEGFTNIVAVAVLFPCMDA